MPIDMNPVGITTHCGEGSQTTVQLSGG
uniref:Uncharacterized protein n=1 Tax=Arundo donax TaxID=35708 RepID=A0A0A8Z4P8_ARUDO